MAADGTTNSPSERAEHAGCYVLINVLDKFLPLPPNFNAKTPFGERVMLRSAAVAVLWLASVAPALAIEFQVSYRGTYTCSPGQGITGETSTFTIDTNRNVKLVQVVYSVAGGSIFPTAVFEYQGRFEPRTRTFSFTSSAIVGENHYWVAATPPNKYVMSRDGRTLTRYIVNPGCTASPYAKLQVFTPTPGPVSPPLRMRPGGHG
jgi:hypothetical protein